MAKKKIFSEGPWVRSDLGTEMAKTEYLTHLILKSPLSSNKDCVILNTSAGVVQTQIPDKLVYLKDIKVVSHQHVTTSQ